MNDILIIGMLSGTSRDGVDAVLVNFSRGAMQVLHALCAPYPPAIKLTLEQLLESGRPPGKEVAALLDENLGRFFARTAQNLVRESGMEMRDIHAIGSHGQTVWHQPDGENPVSIQLGRPELIARGAAATVVADFRAADMRAGGQGAPLAPLLHRELFHSGSENRAVLNIGGIANLTLLPAGGGISGFDCGPGNCLMDAWTFRHLRKDYDHNGGWAANGYTDPGLLETMLDDPYFKRPAPKSTGPEYFNMHWLEDMLDAGGVSAPDVQATLAELTAASIASSLREAGEPARLLVCGGGVHNAYLMRRIRDTLPKVIVESTAYHGVDPDWVEGLLFAWLAQQRLDEQTLDTAPVTGASGPVLLGEVFTPPGHSR